MDFGFEIIMNFSKNIDKLNLTNSVGKISIILSKNEVLNTATIVTDF